LLCAGVRLARSRVIQCALLCLGLVQLAKVGAHLAPGAIVSLDFRQEYCLARALGEGTSLYERIDVLAPRYIGSDGVPLPSPSAHPPSAATLFLPVGLLPYHLAAAGWLAVSLGLLLLTLRTIARTLGWPVSGWHTMLLMAAALLWPPIVLDLGTGNLTIALLACVVASWAALRQGREGAAGLWLGVGAALKLLPAYLVVYLLLRRRWRAAGVATAVFAALAVVPVLACGPSVWVDYFSRAVPQVVAVYQDLNPNLSLYGMFYRHTVGHPFLAPLVAMSMHPWIEVVALGVILTGFSLVDRSRRALRPEAHDLEWSLLVVAILLLSPLTWHLSFVLLVLPLAVFVRGVAEHRSFAGRLGGHHALVVLGLGIPLEVLAAGAKLLATLIGWGGTGPLPGASGLVLSIPSLALLGAFAIACQALRRTAARESARERATLADPAAVAAAG
jgi:alpha-1,2-mannosyltransferase